MYCRNYTGTVSHVLCREVCYTLHVSLLGRVHKFLHSIIQSNPTLEPMTKTFSLARFPGL